MKREFAKMNGAGNDFIVIEALSEHFDPELDYLRRIADRDRGVGCDQILIIDPPRDDNADFECRIFNADGSEAEQCGNGMRCIGRYALDRGLACGPLVKFSSPAGIIDVERDADNSEWMEAVMGIPRFDPASIPFTGPEDDGELRRMEFSRMSLPFALASMGNPHAVIFLTDDEWRDIDVEGIGRHFNECDLFSNGVNVGFMRIRSSDRIQLRVYERGVGETLACGSGAAAAVAVGRRRGLLDASTLVSMRGGELRVKWEGETRPLRLCGDANFDFDGHLP